MSLNNGNIGVGEIKNISDFMGNVVQEKEKNSGLNFDRMKKKDNKKFFLEYNLINGAKWFFIEFFMVIIVFLSNYFKNDNYFIYIIWFFLYFNLVGFLLIFVVFGIMMYETVQIRQTKKSKMYKYKEQEILKFYKN